MQIKSVTGSNIAHCPQLIMSPSHYRDDGMCKCVWPPIGMHVKFPTRQGGQLQFIEATVLADPRNDTYRVAVQPIGITGSGRKPAVRMRNRNKLTEV